MIGGAAGWDKRERLIDRLLIFLASVRIPLALALTAWLFSEAIETPDRSRLVRNAFQMAIYGSSGAFLLRRGITDSRARYLGLTFLLIASAYAQLPYIVASAHFPQAVLVVLVFIAGLRPDFLLAYSFWMAVEEFPSPTAAPPIRRAITIGRGASLTLGLFFMGLGILRIVLWLTKRDYGIVFEALALLFHSHWYMILPMMGFAFPAFIFKFRQFRKIERRRATLFFTAAIFTFVLPLSSISVGDGVDVWLELSPQNRSLLMYGNNLFLAMFPFFTIYTVLAHRVLDVQSIARSAVRHMLARYSVVLLGLLPFAFLVYFGWANKESTLAELFSGSQAIVLVSAAALGALTMLYRQPILDFIDRRFFRQRYDARRVLTELAEQVRGTRNLVELSKLVEKGVDLALHLERVSLLIETPNIGRFVDPLQHLRPLDQGSQLITLVSGSREPIAVDLESPSSPFLSMPEEEKLWLIESKVEMIAPAHNLDGSLIGLLVLGPKRSELPFLREDRELLAGVASSAGLVVELLRLKETAGPAATRLSRPADSEVTTDGETPAIGAEEAAALCIACDRVFPPGTLECTNCFVDLETTNAPYILRELYRLDHRIGTGGMAVVYRAKDLKLGRAVAVKTLPKVNAEAAMRLRREARTAASVSHPGLAAIYGLETWRGVPLIVTEFLAGGTLADQLGKSPLSALDALDLARTIAVALAKIHSVGILHRDVKPSNIGYTEDGDVKLLDFGIARIQHDFRQEHGESDSALGPDGHSRIVNTASMMLPRTRTGQLVGTVTYLSPEAARGEKPDPSVDLWALAVCLYESLTAENLFYGRTFPDVLNQIRDLNIPDVRKKVPSCPEPLALFLAQELSLDRSRRAEDGLEMATRLDQARAKILAG